MEYRESHQILSMLVLRLGGLRHQCEPSLKLSHTIKPWVFETIWSLSSLSYKFPSPPPYKPILKEPDRLRPTRDYQPVFWYEDQSGSYMDKILCLPPSLAPWLHNKGMPVRKKELTVNPVMSVLQHSHLSWVSDDCTPDPAAASSHETGQNKKY